MRHWFRRDPGVAPTGGSWLLRGLSTLLLLVVALMLGLMWWWSSEPDSFDVVARAKARASGSGHQLVTGYVSTATLLEVGETVLHKRGGYLSNDVMPPGVIMDNLPNWEFGVVTQMRDFARSLRNDFSRSQTQSEDDIDLREADPLLSFSNDSWMFPATESEYGRALGHVEAYLARIADDNQSDAQFHARADNLADWLALVEKRLGSLSQRLAASVGQQRVNTDLSNDSAAERSTPGPGMIEVKTPWTKIDDVFYEARGASWALIHFLHAVEHDFGRVLEKKNATVSLRQIIRELESTQDPVWSPMILNGRGFAFVANHSLVMANYISRANAALIDLRRLLEQG